MGAVQFCIMVLYNGEFLQNFRSLGLVNLFFFDIYISFFASWIDISVNVITRKKCPLAFIKVSAQKSYICFKNAFREISVHIWSTSLECETKTCCLPLQNVLAFKTFKTINDFSKLSTKLFCQYPFMRNDLYPLIEPNLCSSLCFLGTFLDLIIWKNCSPW